MQLENAPSDKGRLQFGEGGDASCPDPITPGAAHRHLLGCPVSRKATPCAGHHQHRPTYARQYRTGFGDRDSGAYLIESAWTKIIRHQQVNGRASPDDPALTDYWAARRRSWHELHRARGWTQSSRPLQVVHAAWLGTTRPAEPRGSQNK